MKRILFIEDERTLQKTFKDLLEKESFEMISAFDGKEGLSLIKTEKPDLILLDLILPGVDGFEVLKRIKVDEEIKEIPIIILTNLEDMADINRALELGATTYLVKANYSPKEVLEKIKKALK